MTVTGAWNASKNAKLRKERAIGFENIVFHIERSDLLDILQGATRSVRRQAQ
jgi:hypothetical protein